MPDDSQNPDNLDQDQTFVGEREKVSADTGSLGQDATHGDADDNSRDEFEQVLEAFDEVIDLEKRYDIQEELGAGGMGSVLKAVDKRLGRTVALKFLLEELGNSAQALRRFMTEAKAIAMLNHNNIVQIYEMERSARGPFIVMEYVEGGSLVDLLEKETLELERAVDIICQVCDGLSVAHDQGITHRDIKPANILMTTDGVPKLSDFGLARQSKADHGQTQVGAILGTIDFMPTEQRRDATAVDARSDLWSLAATLYQMVTGKSPKVIRLRDVPPQLQDIISKGLEESQDDRYQSATEFRDALRASLQSVDSAPLVEVDLGAGECPKCHAKNEASRKFCRGCGESLLQTCLSCEQPMPVWEIFCGDCGADQKELIETRHAELTAKREKAESLANEFDFDESLHIAQEVGLVEDSRLQQFKEWSETFIEETTAEKERQELIAAERYAEAMKHHDAFDYPSAINTLETVPGAMQNVDHSSFLKQLRSDHDESERLITRIKAELKDRKFDGLLNLVNRAVQLRGDREDLKKLQVNLQNRTKSEARKQQAEEKDALRLAPLPPPQSKSAGTPATSITSSSAFERSSSAPAPGKPSDHGKWVPHHAGGKGHGRRMGKTGWLQIGTGRILYQETPPGERATNWTGPAQPKSAGTPATSITSSSAFDRSSSAPKPTKHTSSGGKTSANGNDFGFVTGLCFFLLGVAIPICHAWFGGWYTPILCALGGLLLVITAYSEEMREPWGLIGSPFIWWGFIWLVRWIWSWFF